MSLETTHVGVFVLHPSEYVIRGTCKVPPPRGTLVRTDGGAVGWFVGRTPSGVDVVSYPPMPFDANCKAFDDRMAARRAKQDRQSSCSLCGGTGVYHNPITGTVCYCRTTKAVAK